jgi:hypothetical protein
LVQCNFLIKKSEKHCEKNFDGLIHNKNIVWRAQSQQGQDKPSHVKRGQAGEVRSSQVKTSQARTSEAKTSQPGQDTPCRLLSLECWVLAVECWLFDVNTSASRKSTPVPTAQSSTPTRQHIFVKHTTAYARESINRCRSFKLWQKTKRRPNYEPVIRKRISEVLLRESLENDSSSARL